MQLLTKTTSMAFIHKSKKHYDISSLGDQYPYILNYNIEIP